MSARKRLLHLTSFLAINIFYVLAATLPPSTLPLGRLPEQDDTFALYNSTAVLTVNPQIESILSFWFDPRYPHTRWFIIDPAFDAQIATNFGDLVTRARTTTFLDDWASSPQGCLALILLLDQFPRNIYRGSFQSYSSDAKALSIARKAVEQRLDRSTTLIQQSFFYLPYMHDESLQSQDTSVSLFKDLSARTEPGNPDKTYVDSGVDFAVRHQKVIEMFGRFPARNEALHRRSTPEETEFLRTHPWGY